MIKLLIIDALNLVRRVYSALPTGENDAPDITHFLNACENAFQHNLQQHQPSHAVCVFEHYDTTWRHDLYPPYKANRKPQPRPMLDAFPALKSILENLSIACLDIEGYEADDIIASIVHITREHDCHHLILSTDHLMAQLVDEKTVLYDQFGQQPIDAQMILKRYGVQTHQLPDYFALVGSNSVNIPGIVGIGAKTASKLLANSASIDRLIEADKLEPKHAKLLENQQHSLYLFRALFRLRMDCPISGNLKAWRAMPIDNTQDEASHQNSPYDAKMGV